MNSLAFKSPIGVIEICENEGFLVSLTIYGDEKSCCIEPIQNEYSENSQVLIETKKQLQEYFDGHRKEFDIPIKLNTTEFISKVLHEVKNIPYGETDSYGNIALKVGNSMASRAVGMANNKNPVPIIIPCHRVIAKDGKLRGYAYGLDMKEYLLNLERENVKY